MTLKRAASIFLVVIILALIGVYFIHRKAAKPSIASEYGAALALCGSFPNGSTQHVSETTRLFINLPKTLYPNDIRSFFKTATGTATAGYVSNGGMPGNAMEASSTCSSTYFEFDGTGEVDLSVPAATPIVPDYLVHFVVSAV